MKRNPEKRGNWYLLTGLIIGVAFGLVYAWVISPVVYVDAGPYTLREDFKDQYRLLVALAYQADNNLPRAKARLDQLKDADIARAIAMQAQRSLAANKTEQETRALGLLAVAMGEGPTPERSATLVPATMTPQLTPTPSPTPVLMELNTTPSPATESGSSAARTMLPTNTPLPTRTPTATVGAPFILEEQTHVCNPDLTAPLLQVLVYDAADQQVPGVEVIVTWNGSEEHFFTGLKPELGLGYADFTMATDQVYVLRLADGGQPVSDLAAAECEAEDGARYYGSWLLIFTASGR